MQRSMKTNHGQVPPDLLGRFPAGLRSGAKDKKMNDFRGSLRTELYRGETTRKHEIHKR